MKNVPLILYILALEFCLSIEYEKKPTVAERYPKSKTSPTSSAFITKPSNTTKSLTILPQLPKKIAVEEPVQEEPIRKLTLYCSSCTSKQRHQWRELDLFLKNYLNETDVENRPKILVSNTQRGKISRSGAQNAYIIFTIQNETTRFNLGNIKTINYTEFSEFLKSQEPKSYRLGSDRIETTKIFKVTHVNFKESIEESNKTWLILLTDDEEHHDDCDRYGDHFLDLFREKLKSGNVTNVDVATLKATDVDDQLVRKRLSIDVQTEKCPIFVKINGKEFETFDGSPHVEHEIQLTNALFKFVEKPFNKKTTQELGADLTDVEYMYNYLSFISDQKLRNKTFIIIGISGGLSVIALAVSIFWGLKSSSFETKRSKK